MAHEQEPIVVVGLACRLPGDVSSLGNLWDMISNERTGHCKVPQDRWDADKWHHPDPDRKGGISVKHGYFLQHNVRHFDAPFFSTTAKEAAAMDPMKRLLLEVSYESIENAGIPVDTLMNSRTGCYVGCMTNDYEMLSLRDIYDIGHTAASATSEAMTANRVSWFFGLKGPSLTLDTACSSSLYALHLACQSLRTGETNMSLVAGVNLLLYPNTMHQLSAMHMLSPEGISHTFDDRANGYGRGEGIACLVVKRLSDALRDGDTIRAVIRGTGANADGKTASITQPSSAAQADLIRDTYAAAGLDMKETQYFECHGTGTPVGDPIELQALADTLGARRREAGLGPLYIGSIKPNVGHTEGCSGLAGILKAIACLERGKLAPTYGVETINPKLKLADWNLMLPERTMQWPTHGQRRISVNSFGFGGANAHAILDDAHHYLTSRGIVGNHNTAVTLLDYETDSESGISVGPGTPMSGSTYGDNRGKLLFVMSSKDQAGLKRMTQAYHDALSTPQALAQYQGDVRFMQDLAHTLATRRSQLDFGGFCVASSLKELLPQLSQGFVKFKRSHRPQSNVLFVFTGQGAQWATMGMQLLQSAVFKSSILQSQEYLVALGCQWDAIEELSKQEDESNIAKPEYSQTLCTVLQVALVDLLRYSKVLPRATVGHSSGEIAAAYAAGYITHADAIKIAYVRGLTSESVTKRGAMLAAGVSREDAQTYLAKVPVDSAVVACVNSPSSVTLSGDTEAINELEKLISADGKFARKLKVTTAYHSPHMKAVAQGYFDQIGTVDTQSSETATFMYSSLTGKLVSPDELSADYWVSNMCAPVEFSSAVSGILSHIPTADATKKRNKSAIQWDAIVEIGPHTALKGPVQQIIAATKNKTAKEAPYMAMVLRGEDAIDSSLTAAGKLWAIGYPVDLSALNYDMYKYAGRPPKSLADLPAYPWNHNREFWHEAYSTKSNRYPSFARTDLLGVPEDMQNSFEPKWNNYLRISENPWIEHHRITGTTLYPAAGMLVMALEGALQLTLSNPSRKVHGFRFDSVHFERGMVIPAEDEGAVKTSLSLIPSKHNASQYEFIVYSTTLSTSWTKHCYGNISVEYDTETVSEVEGIQTDLQWLQQTEQYQLLKSSDGEIIDVETFYDHLQDIGMEYGPLFRNVVSLKALPEAKASHGSVIIPDTKIAMPEEYEPQHIMHPATMDAIFHLLLAAFNDGRPVEEAAVPYSINTMFVAADQPHGAGNNFLGYGQLMSKSHDGREIIGDLIVSDSEWSAPKLTVHGFALRQVTAAGDSMSALDLHTKKCASIKWSKDLELFDNQNIELPQEVYVLYQSSASLAVTQLATSMEAELLSQGVAIVHHRNISSIVNDDLVGKYVISLLEAETPLIYSWTESEFTAFKQIVSTVDHLLWVTRGDVIDSFAAGTEFAPAQGLLRVLRNEYSLTSLPQLDLSRSFDPISSDSAQLIVNVWMASQKHNAEMEFAESGGDIHTPRAVDEAGLDAELQLAAGTPQPVRQKLGDIKVPLKLNIMANDSCLGIEDFGSISLEATDVEIQVSHIGLDGTDVPSTTSVWGKEAVGTVVGLGKDVDGFFIGQRVAVIQSTGANHTVIRAPSDWVTAIPADISVTDAITMPIAFITAQYALLEVARLRRGMTVLVNAAGSALGQAAVQIGQTVGATVFALVSSKAEKNMLIKRYGLAESVIFDSAMATFKSAVLRATEGRGVACVFNPYTTYASSIAASTLGDFGYFIDLSAIESKPSSLPYGLRPNASIVRIDMHHILQTRPEIVKTLFQEVFQSLARRGAIKSIAPTHLFLVSQVSDALEVARAENAVKVVVELNSDDVILTIPPPGPKLSLSSDATYVLAGGLGALGTDISNMMIEHGAKKLIFLSRSGGDKSADQLEGYRSRGIEAEAFKCDITNAQSVAVVFEQLKAQGRDIKGVIQCAMVLEDTIFENMTYTKWQRAFLPKTQGSRNLLAQLWPGDKPFFILLSSITGVIGNTAQSNYASGNTFEDALAHHARNHLGIQATSIDVGLVSDSSHFTEAGEFGDLDGYVNRYQHGWKGLQTNLDELRIAIIAAMRGTTADGQQVPAQFVLGLGSNLVRKPGGTGFERDRKFDLRVSLDVTEEDGGLDKEESIAEQLKRAESIAEAGTVVEQSLRKHIAFSSGIPADEVDVQRPLPEFGVDSLTAVEIRNRCLKEMKSDISVFELLSSVPMADLAVKIATRSGYISFDRASSD